MKRIVKFILLLFLFVLLVSGVGFYFGYRYYNTQIEKASTNKQTEFTISEGEGISQISSDLATAHIISQPLLFDLYLKSHGLDKTIEAGSYLLPSNVSIVQLGSILQKGNFYNTITIKEGLRVEEVANVINRIVSVNNPDKQFSPSDFINLSRQPSLFSYPFISPTTTSLEGYLFADTYNVKKSITAKDMIILMLDNFNKKIFVTYGNESFPSGFNFSQAVVLSSILEREAKTDADKKLIADILIRRLNSGTPLGVDSSLQYVLGFSAQENTWWRQTIYQSDLALNSPYNSRLNPGLPPTAISNFSQNTFSDAISPTPNQYNYYISDNYEKIHYAVTSAEQNANIAKYLRG